VAWDPLQRRRLWERRSPCSDVALGRGPCWNPLEQRRGSSGSSDGDGRGPGARGLRFGMDGAPCFLSRKELGDKVIKGEHTRVLEIWRTNFG